MQTLGIFLKNVYNVIIFCTYFDYYKLIHKKARELKIPPHRTSQAAEIIITITLVIERCIVSLKWR